MKHRYIATSLLALGTLGVPMFAQADNTAQPARPGTVNYIEGTVALDGQQITSKQIGSLEMEPGQEITTGSGKVEILLTPGVFLRVDSNSAVKMISPGLTLTQVQVERGRAAVEVDEIHDQNNLQMIDAGVTTRLVKKGYYEFDANNPTVRVFKGKADVEQADKTRDVKGGHELALATGPEKPSGFNRGDAEDGLFQWSKLRSQYLAEANNELSDEYADAGYGPGWYWDPYGWGYTFIGGGPFYSPFGWGFYPFGWGGWYGGYGGWGGGGWYGGPRYYGHPYRRFGDSSGFRGGAVRSAPAPTFHSGGMNSFHGGLGGGGGFHGGMSAGGGFHGGGMHR